MSNNPSEVWKRLESAKADLVKRAESLRKSAFIEMPGGMPQGGDPAAGGMPPPGDPSMGGAPVDPAMMGGMPPPGGDPAAAGMPPVDPTMGGAVPPGIDPALAGALGGMPPVDPAAAAGGAVAGAGGAGTPEPTITITLSQLWEVVKKVLGLAKQIGANGQGVSPDGTPAAPPTQPQISQDAIKSAVMEALGAMR